MYEEQLIAFASLGRYEMEFSVGVLLNQTKTVLSRLQSILPVANPGSPELIAAFEQLHWLALFSGYLLCDGDAGEVPMIPLQAMKYAEDCGAVRLLPSLLLMARDLIIANSSLTAQLSSLQW